MSCSGCTSNAILKRTPRLAGGPDLARVPSPRCWRRRLHPQRRPDHRPDGAPVPEFRLRAYEIRQPVSCRRRSTHRAPYGAKGLNLALADVRVLADVLERAVLQKDLAALEEYSPRALARVWKSQHFSYWMTTMLHRTPEATTFRRPASGRGTRVGGQLHSRFDLSRRGLHRMAEAAISNALLQAHCRPFVAELYAGREHRQQRREFHDRNRHGTASWRSYGQTARSGGKRPARKFPLVSQRLMAFRLRRRGPVPITQAGG